MPMNPDTRELKPRRLRLSSGARELLVGYSDWVEREQLPGGRWVSVTAYASKSAEQATRIAGVLSLMEDLDAREVSAEAMKNGIALAAFYLDEAMRLVDAAIVSEETARAEALREWLLERWPGLAKTKKRTPQIITPRDVVQWGPGALRETLLVKKAIAILEELGWLQELEKGTLVDGTRRKRAYRIVST
jgi:hypothetical protein